MRPSLVLFLVLWLKLVKDFLKVRCRSASLQRTFKKSFTSFSHSTRNKTRDGLIRVRNIRALNGRFNTSITQIGRASCRERVYNTMDAEQLEKRRTAMC